MPPTARRATGVRPLLAWIAVIVWMGVIFGFSSLPGLDSGLHHINFGIAKLGHVTVFSVLGFLSAIAMDVSGVRNRIWWTVVLVAMYAIFDELHQSFVPGRDPLLSDVAIDTISGWIAAMVWVRFARPFLAVRRWRRRRPFAERAAAAPSRNEVVAPVIHASAGEHAVGRAPGDEATR
jgi:VanZ family protein